jgi:hypothetical protein
VRDRDIAGRHRHRRPDQTIPLPTTLTVRHSVETNGLAASLNFNPFDTGAGRLLSSSVDTSAVGSAPIVLALLVYAWFIGGDAWVRQVADALIPAIQQAMVAAALAGLEKFTRHEDAGLVDPILYLLRLPQLPLPGAPSFTAGAPPPSWLDVDVTSTTIRMLVTLGSGTRGNARRITRSSLAAGGSAGLGDVGVMIVSNTCLLRDMVRSRIAAAFGIPPGAFSSAGPCFVPGPAPITVHRRTTRVYDLQSSGRHQRNRLSTSEFRFPRADGRGHHARRVVHSTAATGHLDRDSAGATTAPGHGHPLRLVGPVAADPAACDNLAGGAGVVGLPADGAWLRACGGSATGGRGRDQ